MKSRIKFWQFLLNRSQNLKNKMDELREQLENMSWGQRNVPGREGPAVARDLANLKEAYNSTVVGERDLMREYTLLIDSAARTRAALESSYPSDTESSPTLVYWQDEAGVADSRSWKQ
ncbi:hypothetical protein FEF26_15575 [Nesterenkonia salmonea]|uniref:Flagellar protein FlgN n=1 Tax=Nesterenkonia salmonea TaxID=1804987 RepID=A0A5R9AZT7_9MICC|nr:hypothetical protein FEF26_15575 [Nesterenkonia salmonea]